MKNEFLIAITQLSAEKNLPKEVVFQAVEAALLSAYRKENLGANQNISVKIQPSTGEVKVFAQKRVVESAEDTRTEISLVEARKIKPGAELEDTLDVELAPLSSGRIAAQTAKQVVLQRLREAEREVVFEEFADREGDILSGIVQRVEPKQIVVDLGRTEAILPVTEQVPTEHYRVGQRVKGYLLEVHRSTKGPQVIISRTHRNLVRRLFELEVPEIYNGVVELKAIAREPGSRTKVGVVARQEGVDPVGSCVGLRGIRIQNIVNELNGEKIDVIQWHLNPATWVANALSPAQVVEVEIDESTKTATVVVPDRQLSLAIGKDGQNARLAAKLTGWRIDIKSASAAKAEREELEARLPKPAAVEPRRPMAEEIPVLIEEEEAPVVARAPAAAIETITPPVEGETVPPVETVMAEEAATAEGAAREAIPKEAEETLPWILPEEPAPLARGQVRFAEEVIPSIKVPAKAKKGKKVEALREEVEGPKPKRLRREKPILEEEEEIEEELALIKRPRR